MAVACRYYTQRRLNRASKKLGIPELIVYDQFEDRRVGLRFCTFVTPVQDLGNGCKVMATCILPPVHCRNRLNVSPLRKEHRASAAQAWSPRHGLDMHAEG